MRVALAAAEHECQCALFGAEDAAGDGGVVEGGLWVGGEGGFADGEGGGCVDCGAIDQDFGVEGGEEDTSFGVEVYSFDVRTFWYHGKD